jgi:hypothetical protein
VAVVSVKTIWPQASNALSVTKRAHDIVLKFDWLKFSWPAIRSRVQACVDPGQRSWMHMRARVEISRAAAVMQMQVENY